MESASDDDDDDDSDELCVLHSTSYDFRILASNIIKTQEREASVTTQTQ
jgi:hypothetical protein